MLYAHGTILSSSQAREWLTGVSVHAAKSIDICTAYLRAHALQLVYEGFLSSGYKGKTRILTRWKLQDLLAGASDLESYQYAASHNIEFYINTDFHGKVYKVENSGILLGSANLTHSGFGLNKLTGNEECCTVFADTYENSDYIDRIFNNSVLVTPDLFQKIAACVDASKVGKIDQAEWPQDLAMLLRKEVLADGLFVDDLFFTESPACLKRDSSESGDAMHDLSLLGLNRPCMDSVRIEFRKSKAYGWLLSQLRAYNGEAYFGALTAELHAAILNDPAPYRKDVKKFLGNLLEWSSQLCPDSIQIDRPNHSQRVQLIATP